MENSKLQYDVVADKCAIYRYFYLILMKKWKWNSIFSHLHRKPKLAHSCSERKKEFYEFQVLHFPLNWIQIVNARASPQNTEKNRAKLTF